MKRLFTVVVVGLGILAFAAVSAEEEKPWLDMENCDMCKVFYEHEGLMDNVSGEHHLVANGLLSLTTVTKEYQEAYGKAKDEMMQAIGRMQAGEQLEFCGMCASHGVLQQKGVKIEYVNSDVADISLMTSSDPEIIAMIHEHGKRTNEAMAKMKAGQEQK
jgi:hypothetical protein